MKLLLITNLDHEDRHEDLMLAERLAARFELSIASPDTAVPLLASGAVDACMVRNAWPSRRFKASFAALERLTVQAGRPTYNPLIPGRRGPVENKGYLVDLFEQGYPVIPTYRSPEGLRRADGALDRTVLTKPIDGCSSMGIVETSLGALLEAPVDPNVLYQPKVTLAYEVSFYVLDGHHAWAMRSRGPTLDDRWHLSPYDASDEDIAWAMGFVHWNRLPYGIQRIDAAKLDDGRLLLMEVEDSMPFLSLNDLAPSVRTTVLDAIVDSVQQNLEPRSRPTAGERGGASATVPVRPDLNLRTPAQRAAAIRWACREAESAR